MVARSARAASALEWCIEFLLPSGVRRSRDPRGPTSGLNQYGREVDEM
ncbi:hypothetical protein ACFPRL_26170 [Pseudoclavibacter helvolus]